MRLSLIIMSLSLLLLSGCASTGTSRTTTTSTTTMNNPSNTIVYDEDPVPAYDEVGDTGYWANHAHADAAEFGAAGIGHGGGGRR